MNHSFNVEIAEKYGIEKAVLLENFYFWVKKNQANKKNLHDGKAYTYNTAEALAELFPYIKARKIAQLLREMEFEDGLLMSGQFHCYNRTKSYTLTDSALALYEQDVQKNDASNVQENDTCNIQKDDNQTSKKGIIKDTKSGVCLNTDINADVNANVNQLLLKGENKTTKTTEKNRFTKPSVEEIRAYCEERKNGIDAEYFFDYYESKGWMIGKNKMKDWKASVRTWERNQKSDAPKQSTKQSGQNGGFDKSKIPDFFAGTEYEGK